MLKLRVLMLRQPRTIAGPQWSNRMPASRSRTERWRECLQQIYERGGGIEFSVARTLEFEPQLEGGPTSTRIAPDLMWRVRVTGLSESEMLVERPNAMGTPVNIEDGVELIAVISVGQNRWMFHTHKLGPADGPSAFGPSAPGLRLAMPSRVERCHRRDFLRISTAELHLPRVECWPLLDPTSVAAAETANRIKILDLEKTAPQLRLGGDEPPALLPDVGPPFTAHLLNIGGGGVGLLFSKAEASAAERARLLWMRLHLMPHVPAPLAVTARLAHKHLDSEQNLLAGAAFEFAWNQPHREFVVSQIARFAERSQFRAKAA
ncbi:MAG: hypothetical protein JSR77_06845 [Planctomycetes bacterium]|nr:hypothetical protein [Planctomycetota bacterium]